MSKSIEVTYQWTLDPWPTLPTEPGHSLHSPTFTESSLESEWHMQLYPHGVNTSHASHLSLYLWSKSFGEVRAQWMFALLDSNKNRCHVFRTCQSYVFGGEQRSHYGCDEYVVRDELINCQDTRQRLLPDGLLTIFCQIWIEDYQPSSLRSGFNIEWPLVDFANLRIPYVESPPLTEPKTGTQWCLALRPSGPPLVKLEDNCVAHQDNGQTSSPPPYQYCQDDQYVSLHLIMMSPGRVRAKVMLAMVDSDHNLRFGTEFTFNYAEMRYGYGYNKFISRNLLLRNRAKLLPQDKITFYCEVQILELDSNLEGPPQDLVPLAVPTQSPEPLSLPKPVLLLSPKPLQLPQPILTWTVEDFLRLPHTPGNFLETSGHFHPDWLLRLFPRGMTPEDSGYVALELLPKTPAKSGSGEPWCAVKDSSNKCESHIKSSGVFSPTTNTFIWPRFLLRSTLESFEASFLPGGKLCINCHLRDAFFEPAECSNSFIRFEQLLKMKVTNLTHGDELQSKVFGDPFNESKWSLHVVFEDDLKTQFRYLSCFLECFTPNVFATFTISLLDQAGNKWHVGKWTEEYKFDGTNSIVGWRRFFVYDVLRTHGKTLFTGDYDESDSEKLNFLVDINILRIIAQEQQQQQQTFAQAFDDLDLNNNSTVSADDESLFY